MNIYLLVALASTIFLLIRQYIQHSAYVKRQEHLNEIRNLPQPTKQDFYVGCEFYYFVGGIGHDDYEILEFRRSDLDRWDSNSQFIKLEWSRIKE